MKNGVKDMDLYNKCEEAERSLYKVFWLLGIVGAICIYLMYKLTGEWIAWLFFIELVITIFLYAVGMIKIKEVWRIKEELEL